MKHDCALTIQNTHPNKMLFLSMIAIALFAFAAISLINIAEESDASEGEVFTVGGIRYEITSESEDDPYEVKVIKNGLTSKYKGDIQIPKSVTYDDETYSVTAIGDQAFQGADITSISIPDTVTSVGKSAFAQCTGITSLTIPASVTSIGSRAFNSCFNLTTVYLFADVDTISEYLFYGCTHLKNISISASVKSIEKCAFDDCNDLVLSLHRTESVTTATVKDAFLSCYFKDICVPYTKYNEYRDSSSWSAYKDKIRPAVEVPVANSGLVYNGSEQTGITAVIGEFTLSGTVSATDAGNYTATATLVSASPSRYWFDGISGDTYNVQWSIAKAESMIAIAKDSSCVDKNFNVVATNTGDGSLSYEIISGKDVADVSSDGNITAKSIGKSMLKITAAETGNYKSSEKTFEISIKDHIHVTVAGKVPTTTETGLTEGEECSECHMTLVQQDIIPKTETGHSVVETVDARAEFDVPKSGEIKTLVIILNEVLNEYTVALDEGSTDSVEGKHIDFAVESVTGDDDRYKAVMTADGKEFNGTMNITVPYDPAKGTPSIRWVEGNEDMTIVSINEDDRTITFVTTHNSTYEVEYEKSYTLVIVLWSIPAVLFFILICTLIYAEVKKK